MSGAHISLASDERDAFLHVRSLAQWLQDDIVDDLQIDIPEADVPEHMGSTEAILTLVLTAPSSIVVARSIHTWLQARKKSLKITIKNQTRTITLSAENYNAEDVARLLDESRETHE